MSEVEFDRLLEAVRMAIEPAPQEDFPGPRCRCSMQPPKAANDNQHGLAADSVSRRLVRRLLRPSRDRVRPLSIINARH